jgi:hypothetical protein
MTQLQTDAAPAADTQAADPTQQATGSALATDPGDNQGQQTQDDGKAKVEFDPEQQAILNNAVNRQHGKFKEEQRGHQDTQALLLKSQQDLAALQSQQPGPIIPPMPDSFDDDFDEKVVIRDAAIVAVAQHEQNQAYIAQANANAQQQAQLQTQEVQAQNAQTLVENSAKLGISNDDLGKAAAVVGSYNISTELRTGLMTDPDGPVMLAYLAANPLEIEALQSMGVFDASNHLGTVIRQKASALKPKTSGAPDPPTLLHGNGKPEDKDPANKGTTFE